jgi:hypothetical protein
MSGQFARYDSREIKVQHFGGAWYVVRRDMYPHTTYDTSAHGSAMVTRQGSAVGIGIRQGGGYDGGFTCRRWELPDRDV